MGEKCFAHKNQITLRTSSRDRVSSVVAIAYETQTFSLSDWLNLAPFEAYFLYQDLPPTEKHNVCLAQKLQVREIFI
jgi:hypothetical protein